MDLRDVLVDGSGLTPRLVCLYIRQLPVESATIAAIRGGDQFYGWGFQMYMFANLIDAVRENTWVTMAAAGPKKKPKAPEPFERPGKKSRKKSGGLFAAMARAAWKKGNR